MISVNCSRGDIPSAVRLNVAARESLPVPRGEESRRPSGTTPAEQSMATSNLALASEPYLGTYRKNERSE